MEILEMLDKELITTTIDKYRQMVVTKMKCLITSLK